MLVTWVWSWALEFVGFAGYVLGFDYVCLFVLNVGYSFGCLIRSDLGLLFGFTFCGYFVVWHFDFCFVFAFEIASSV